MYLMQTIAADSPVCLRSFTRLRRAKTAERIEVRSGARTLGGPENVVLDSSHNPDHPTARGRWVHSMRTLPNDFGLLFHI